MLFRSHVLDAQQHPVPLGVPGALHIGGLGLSSGYWQRQDLTAERFILNPLEEGIGNREQGTGTKEQEEPRTKNQEPRTKNQEPGKNPSTQLLNHPSTLYKTGDRVRIREDGTLEYLGRLDHQVKLRGFRIELGEIEALLTEHPDVSQAVVVLREKAAANPQLVAYFVKNAKPRAAHEEHIPTSQLTTHNPSPHLPIPPSPVRLSSRRSPLPQSPSTPLPPTSSPVAWVGWANRSLGG